ncbi:MAG: DMT family transporter [Terriglobia bacterium]
MGLMNVIMLWVTFLWAANAVACKFALRGFSPMALAELRVVGAALGFWIVFLAVRGWPRLHFSRRDWFWMGLLALNGVTLNQASYMGGLSRTSVAHTALIVALGPILVLVLAWLLHMESLSTAKALGMVTAFAGVAVLAAGRPSAGASWLGDMIMLGGRAAFAYYTILLKQGAERYDPLALNAVTFTLGAVLLVPFSARALLHTTEASWTGVPPHAWLALAYMVILGTVVTYLLYAFALTVMTASHAAAFSYLAPVITIALGVWLLSESITGRVWAGGAMILLGLVFTGQGLREGRGVDVQ